MKFWPIRAHGGSYLHYNINEYHPTSGLMQILYFDWLRYYRSISNSHPVAKFAGFVNLLISFYSQINIFFAGCY